MNERLQTTLVFLKKDSQVLLATKKRGHGIDKWNGAGGKIEPGETIEQAAMRECQEELGIKAIDLKQVGELNFYQEPAVDQYSNCDCYVFVCEKWEGEPTETEEMAPRWFDFDTIPYDKMWADDKHWLPHVLAGKQIRGEFHFDQNYQLVKNKVEEL